MLAGCLMVSASLMTVTKVTLKRWKASLVDMVLVILG